MPAREPLLVRAAGAVGVAVRVLSRVFPALLGLALLSYGAWLAWPPAGFLTAGALILADQIAGRMTGRREAP